MKKRQHFAADPNKKKLGKKEIILQMTLSSEEIYTR
jgi:hypothetical protein